MNARARRLTLTLHVTASVGWLGAVVAYLALALVGLRADDAEVVRAVYVSLELVGSLVVVPASLATLVTGLVQSLGTEWGLWKHYWIVAKLALTTVGTLVLLQHMGTVAEMADVVSGTVIIGAEPANVRLQLVVHATGGTGVLFTATVLSIFKPWGKTPYGRRQHFLHGGSGH